MELTGDLGPLVVDVAGTLRAGAPVNAFERHVLVPRLDFPHIFVADSASAVSHKHVAVDKPSERMSIVSLYARITLPLIDVVGFPVSILLETPDTWRITWRMSPASDLETRDEVRPADDVVGVEKPERVILEGRDRLDPIQPLGFPPGSLGLVDLEPVNPEDVHLCLACHGRSMEDVQPEDTKDSCVCIRVDSVLREGHDV